MKCKKSTSVFIKNFGNYPSFQNTDVPYFDSKFTYIYNRLHLQRNNKNKSHSFRENEMLALSVKYFDTFRKSFSAEKNLS